MAPLALHGQVHLENEPLATLHGKFAYLTAAWLSHLAATPEAEAAFAKVPQHAATNPSSLVRALAWTSPQQLQLAPWARPLVSRFLCEMLPRKGSQPHAAEALGPRRRLVRRQPRR